jgi:hypothetical protein
MRQHDEPRFHKILHVTPIEVSFHPQGARTSMPCHPTPNYGRESCAGYLFFSWQSVSPFL